MCLLRLPTAHRPLNTLLQGVHLGQLSCEDEEDSGESLRRVPLEGDAEEDVEVGGEGSGCSPVEGVEKNGKLPMS